MNTTFKSFEDLQRALYGAEETESTPHDEPCVREKVEILNKQAEEKSHEAVSSEPPRDTRRADDEAEQSFEKSFLVNNIYPGMKKLGILKDVDIIDTQKEQCAGSDAVYHTGKYDIKVDNKNRTSVFNAYSRGVPLELATDDRYGNRISGWLADEKKETDYILSLHCFIDNSNEKVEFNKDTMKKTTAVEMFLFKLDDIKHYLKARGTSLDEIKEKSDAFEKEFADKYAGVARKDIDSHDRRKEVDDGLFLFTSYYKLKENPTVLLMDESIIKELPNTRILYWDIDDGVREDTNKAKRPDLSPSEHKMAKIRDEFEL